MDCFGTYLTNAQTCDNVRVQSATQWTASVHILHMPKPVIRFVFSGCACSFLGPCICTVWTCGMFDLIALGFMVPRTVLLSSLPPCFLCLRCCVLCCVFCPLADMAVDLQRYLRRVGTFEGLFEGPLDKSCFAPLCPLDLPRSSKEASIFLLVSVAINVSLQVSKDQAYTTVNSSSSDPAVPSQKPVTPAFAYFTPTGRCVHHAKCKHLCAFTKAMHICTCVMQECGPTTRIYVDDADHLHVNTCPRAVCRGKGNSKCRDCWTSG